MTETLKVLVTGASGLLGDDVVRVFKNKGHELIALRGRRDLDVTDANKTLEVVRKHRPDVVIDCVGTHDIDGAESDPTNAFMNVFVAAKNVVIACKIAGATLIHPGSDYVFDGSKDEPYLETDLPNPVNVYGRNKWAVERFISSILPEHFIIRVPILFGAGGKLERNFIYRIYSKIKNGETVKVASDQVTSCGYTVDIALAFEKIARSYHYGTYHLANEGFCSRYELYREVASGLGLDAEKVIPTPSAELKRRARRPKYTVLSTLLVQKIFGIKLRPWNEALRECLKEFRDRWNLP